MKFKKVIAVSAVTSMFMSMTLNVSAARSSTDRYINQMKKNGQISLILDVDAYRAAYSDLEKAFGNNYDAYIKHYLTTGVYEGRTKGVLFDPLTYAEGYGDIKLTFGEDILAIVNHYVNFGVKENRTTGTAVGYEDIAAAIEGGAVRSVGQGNGSSAPSGNQISSGASGSQAVQKPSESQAPSGASGSQTEEKPSESQAPSGASGSQTEEKPSESQAPSGASGSQTEDKFPGISIKRATYIYADDSTLIRVEYYDETDKLIFYSDVINYDSETKSYTEKIYSYDENNNCHVLVRTDTYINGVLSSTVSEGETEQKPSGGETEQKPSEGETEQKPSEGETEQKPSGGQAEDKFPGISIGRTTYIYDNGDALIRVEYYDENNKLIYYSDVVDYDKETKSYTENIYSYDEANESDVLVRTDTYVNGVLSSTTSGDQTEQKPSGGETEQKPSGGQAEDKFPGISIGRTTYIYDNDEALIRVEYYDENNKLIYYSDVVDYDKETKSYTENIYSYDEANKSDVLIRTDTYVNGVLSSTK